MLPHSAQVICWSLIGFFRRADRPPYVRDDLSLSPECRGGVSMEETKGFLFAQGERALVDRILSWIVRRSVIVTEARHPEGERGGVGVGSDMAPPRVKSREELTNQECRAPEAAWVEPARSPARRASERGRVRVRKARRERLERLPRIPGARLTHSRCDDTLAGHVRTRRSRPAPLFPPS
jgi:hypothetical protein